MSFVMKKKEYVKNLIFFHVDPKIESLNALFCFLIEILLL